MLFDRIDKAFVIQSRDLNTRQHGTGRKEQSAGGPWFSLAEEFNSLPHENGIVLMVRSSDPNSAGHNSL